LDLNGRQRSAEDASKNAKVLNVPGQVYLQFLNLNRDLIARTFALLTQQYELAKIDEAKEDLAFQVIDKAEVKVRPSSPNLVLNLSIGLTTGIFLGIFFAYFSEYFERLKKAELKKL
jgi:uncharacterized protein involved in exopolysaccharide biosynthesis